MRIQNTENREFIAATKKLFFTASAMPSHCSRLAGNEYKIKKKYFVWFLASCMCACMRGFCNGDKIQSRCVVNFSI